MSDIDLRVEVPWRFRKNLDERTNLKNAVRKGSL